MSRQGLVTVAVLSALLVSAPACPEPAQSADGAAPAERLPDPALGQAIAAQGNAALREIRADSRRQLAQSLRLPELTPPDTEVADAGRTRARPGAGAAVR